MYETAKIVGERTLKIDQHLAKLVAEVYRLVAPFFRTRCIDPIFQFSSVQSGRCERALILYVV